MWAELSQPWQAALEEAWSAYCAGSIPIGAVVTDAMGKVISRGRNHRNDHLSPGVVLGHHLAHAELNALLALDRDQADLHPCTLYTTAEPCPLCMGALYMSGVRSLAYASRDPWAGSANLIGATPYLSRKEINVIPPEQVDLEIILVALSTEYFLHHIPHAKLPYLTDQEIPSINCGVELGKQLFALDSISKMSVEGTPANAVVEYLASKLQELGKETENG